MAIAHNLTLSEFIEEVKQELLLQEYESKVPLFSVDEIVLELQVTAQKEGSGGLNIQVVELGAGMSREDVHNVQVTLTPLLSKEERIRLYKKRHPERWKAVEHVNLVGALKGGDEESLSDDLYG